MRLAVAAAMVLVAGAAAAQPAHPPEARRNWTEEKCFRYTKDWREALGRMGQDGLGQDFITSHEAFLAGGCRDQGHVCPRSPRELDLANILTIRAMNAGMGSTFLPFSCSGRR